MKNIAKILILTLTLPALVAGSGLLVEKKESFYKQNFKFISRAPGKNTITSLKRNPIFSGKENQEFFAACTPQITLTPGIPFTGDTSSQDNKFYNDSSSNRYDYPDLDWEEMGPDFVHQITTTTTCDLRIHIDPDPNMLPDLDLILVDNTGGTCNTQNWILAGDHTIIYPDAPAGTYYIIVDGYTKDDYGPYTLYTACAKDILVIDADGSGTSGPQTCGTGYCTDVWANSTFGTDYFYKTAIEGMSPAPAYTYWDKTAQGGNLPPESTLYNYKSILWFSGRAYGDTNPSTPPKIITSKDEEVLKKYLNLGGRIAMIGQDILWDYTAGVSGRLPDGSILNDYFQINEVYNDVWTSSDAFIYSTCSSTYASIPIWGVPGNPLGDDFACDTTFYIFCAFTTSAGAPFYSYIDSIYSRYGEPAFDTYYKSSNNKTLLPAGIRYSASLGIVDWFKTAFFAFCPETQYRTGDTTTVITKLRALLTRIFTWFEEDDTTIRGFGLDAYANFDDSSGNNNGIPDPGETFNLKVGIQNIGTSPVWLKAYEGFEDWYTTLPTPWCKDLGWITPGNYSEVSFPMTLSSSTPIGYRLMPIINFSYQFYDTFEGSSGFDLSGWNYYPINGTRNWSWSTAQSQTPTHSWFAYEEATVSDKVLVSPAIPVSSTMKLSFYHRYNFEGSAPDYCYDGATLEFALGPSFSTWYVVPDTWFIQNGFNGTIRSGYGNPIAGKRAWCGDLNTWTQVIVDLKELWGYDVKFRWHEGDDSTGRDTGWYVDTIRIQEEYKYTAGFGVFVGQPDVLIVKDEYWLPNTTGVDVYNQKIKSIYNPTKGRNYTTAVWDTSMFAAPTYQSYGLPNDFMKNYQFVVWFTGYDFAYTLLPDPWEESLGINPENELTYFLQNRYTDKGDAARFILSSQDYFYEKYEGRSTQIPQNDFGRAYLSVDYVQQDYVKDRDETMKGRDGVFTSEKMVMGLNNGPPTGIIKNYSDMIYADFSQDGTQHIFSYSSPTAFSSTGNLKKDKNYKFIFMPFAFENLQDGTPDGFPSKKRFLERAMCQMLMTSSSQYPPCGYYPPAPMSNVTIYGYKTGGNNAYFYWDPVQFTNCGGEPISGRYRIFGAINNPNPSSFSVINTTLNSYFTHSDAIPAGSCLYLEVRDYIDSFDRPGATCP